MSIQRSSMSRGNSSSEKSIGNGAVRRVRKEAFHTTQASSGRKVSLKPHTSRSDGILLVMMHTGEALVWMPCRMSNSCNKRLEEKLKQSIRQSIHQWLLTYNLKTNQPPSFLVEPLILLV